MRILFKVVAFSIAVSVLALSGCSDSGAPESEVVVRPTSTVSPTQTPLSEAETEATPATSLTSETQFSSSELVVTSGVVLPAKWVELGFQMGGLVDKVLVEPGDRVEEGQLLAELDSGGLEHSVTRAEEALTIANARLALARSGARPEEITAAEARLAEAEARVSEAEIGVEEAQAALNAAVAGVDAARAAVELAITELEVSEAQAGVAGAEASVEAARLARSAADTRVDAAQALRDYYQAQLDLLKAGSRAEDLTILEAQQKQAEAALASARADLEKLQLQAPYAGTVVAVEAQPGETVGTGQVVAVVADLDTLQVRTQDINQLTVAKILPGQEVRISPDAFPRKELAGKVFSVPLRAELLDGVEIFPVIIEFADQDPDLRWGMNVIVEINAAP
jgi:HlyD family secretion protein